MFILIIAFLVFEPIAGFAIDDTAASIEAYGAHGEWLQEFLSAIKKAAQEGPAWRNDPQTVQRHVEDIEYHAEAMIAARKTADRTRAEEARNQVSALLSRGLDKGYFTNADTESLVQSLRRYLPSALTLSTIHARNGIYLCRQSHVRQAHSQRSTEDPTPNSCPPIAAGMSATCHENGATVSPKLPV